MTDPRPAPKTQYGIKWGDEPAEVPVRGPIPQEVAEHRANAAQFGDVVMHRLFVEAYASEWQPADQPLAADPSADLKATIQAELGDQYLNEDVIDRLVAKITDTFVVL